MQSGSTRLEDLPSLRGHVACPICLAPPHCFLAMVCTLPLKMCVLRLFNFGLRGSVAKDLTSSILKWDDVACEVVQCCDCPVISDLKSLQKVRFSLGVDLQVHHTVGIGGRLALTLDFQSSAAEIFFLRLTGHRLRPVSPGGAFGLLGADDKTHIFQASTTSHPGYLFRARLRSVSSITRGTWHGQHPVLPGSFTADRWQAAFQR